MKVFICCVKKCLYMLGKIILMILVVDIMVDNWVLMLGGKMVEM